LPLLARFFPDLIRTPRHDRLKLLAMVGLFFIVVCAVGILRPIKNSIALDGLGATQFYKVYLVSAAVVLFAPIYKWLADRVAWRLLFPLVAVFFALNLLAFRLLYVPGSAVFGVLFYGWYDLFSAALVAQFFMAAQLFFNARSAKQAYPLVIGGGALGAMLGGLITAVLAEPLGTPNLMLVACGLIVIFAAGLPFIYSENGGAKRTAGGERVDLRVLWNHRHVRLIAFSVLLTIVVKELVDYQFNALSKDVFVTRDAVAAFQGQFNAITQWLPLAFVLLLHPLLRRYGVGFAIVALPLALVVTNVGMIAWWGLLTVSTAKGAETALRYSAERVGREILYLPVPEPVRLTAKTYIDVAIEKGLGKVLAAGLIFLFLKFVNYTQLAYVTVILSAVSLLLAFALRREYVRTLASALERRLVSLRGGFASILDAATLPRVRQALSSEAGLQVAFALDLLEQGSPAEARSVAPELRDLLTHSAEGVRERAAALIARGGDQGSEDALKRALSDPVAAVREAAVRALVACSAAPEPLLRELLASGDAAVRTAVLAQLRTLDVPAEVQQRLAEAYIASRSHQRGVAADARVETAYAAQALGANAVPVLQPLVEDEDPAVVAAALRAAAAVRRPELLPACLQALRHSSTRLAARQALRSYGADAWTALSDCLMNPAADAAIRRQIPAVLARQPSDEVVALLLRAITARETDQLLDVRALKALRKLRTRYPQLHFPPAAVHNVLMRQIEAASRYIEARDALAAIASDAPAVGLLAAALGEAWRERRECAFLCLALRYEPRVVFNAQTAICAGHARAHANAVEWLEHEVGYDMLGKLSPVLRAPQEQPASTRLPWDVLYELTEDEDSWIAICARAVCAELDAPLQARSYHGGTTIIQESGMEILERVFLLQRVDLLQGARSAHLALLASLAEQVDVEAGAQLLERGRPEPAMYVLVRGSVELESVADRLVVSEGSAFGTWALIDDAPSLISARALQPSQLLRVNRSDFFDVLEDTPELSLGLLQGLARRVRTLLA
jgi:AAA family ATP:ADP antiporter